MNVEQLLWDVSAILKEHTTISQKTGECFNIFEITNIQTNEVAICRVLYELLSPTGSHYQETTYLALFLEKVLRLNLPDEELCSAKVYREYETQQKRRIDLAIETPQRFIPIEVKIYANDQYQQCADYFKQAKNSPVYYLTRYGEPPSEFSAKGLTATEFGYEEVECISFATDILYWLEACVSHQTTLRLSPIREVLLQLIMAIRTFTNQIEGEQQMKIKNILMQSPSHIRSAIAIQNSLEEAMKERIKHLFEAIEERVDYPKIMNEYDYSFRDFQKINTFYQRKNTFPGINYLYRSNVRPNTDVWVRVEIDDDIFIGYCCPVNGKAGSQPLQNDEIRTLLHLEPRVHNWWSYWECLPNDSCCPNFKYPNEYFIQLFDEAKFDHFVDYTVNKITELLNR